MSVRQQIMKKIYPALMWFNKITGNKRTIAMNNNKQKPIKPFSELSTKLNSGETLHFESLKGKKILLVNTASECGYTGQYAELQELQDRFKDRLQIIGFPANNFGEQEKGSDQEIAAFCTRNFGVSFPLAAKSTVIRGPEQHEVFQWLTEKAKNGWNDQQPTWNFSKYLISEDGVLLNYFDPGVSPLDKTIQNAIES